MSENLFDVDEIIEKLIYEYFDHRRITVQEARDVVKKIILITVYERELIQHGKCCKTCKNLPAPKNCRNCDSDCGNWTPRYTKEDFGL